MAIQKALREKVVERRIGVEFRFAVGHEIDVRFRQGLDPLNQFGKAIEEAIRAENLFPVLCGLPEMVPAGENAYDFQPVRVLVGEKYDLRRGRALGNWGELIKEGVRQGAEFRVAVRGEVIADSVVRVDDFLPGQSGQLFRPLPW